MEQLSEEQIQAMSEGFSKAYKEMNQDEKSEIKAPDSLAAQIWEYLSVHPERVYDKKEGVSFPSEVIIEALKKFL